MRFILRPVKMYLFSHSTTRRRKSNYSTFAMEGDVEMTPEWRAEISRLSIQPPPATDRTEERKGIVYQGAKSE